jgi:type IV pilus assembly protein PilC
MTRPPQQPLPQQVRDGVYEWEGKDRLGRPVRGETRARGEHQLRVTLRRQGIVPGKIRQRRRFSAQRIKPRDISLFTRQFATLMQAGVPVLQAFDIVGRGHPHPGVARMLGAIRADVESGTSLSAAFRKHPHCFDALYGHLVAAGEAAGMLDTLLERLSVHLEKTEAIRSRIRAALIYPLALVLVSIAVVSILLVWVVPAFQDMFSSFGADLPAPTLLVMAVSGWLSTHGAMLLAVLVAGLLVLGHVLRRQLRVQQLADRLLLRLPVLGALLQKAVVARWCRTLSTMFGAGVPLGEALNSVGGASGNAVYAAATEKLRQDVSTGTSLAHAMTQTRLFPPMVLQMCAIGEESGSVEHMLGKAAGFLEAEVDDTVAGLSSLLEPVIIVGLGTLIGAIVVAMYLPIFRLGQVV